MLGKRKALIIGIVLVAASLTLSACGGSAKKATTPKTETTQTSQTTSAAADDSPASVESCLVAAGFDVVSSGDLPIVEHSKALGVRLPGGGKIMPGSLSAAIFWYGSSADATSVMRNDATMFGALAQFDKIVVAYDPIPPADAQSKIEACIPTV
jgi:hypothetical protein